mgnify:CR=1 FL=1
MTPTETVTILRQFNEWQMGDGPLDYVPSGARMNGMGASREAALKAKLEAAEKERDALQAKVEAMERQKPVASVWRCDNGHIHGSCERTLPMGTKLYALPGAKGE